MARKMSLELPLPPEIEQLREVLGFELYVVGGVVRDLLFAHLHSYEFEPKDYDLATPEHPDVVLDRLRSPQARALNITALTIGKSFGVVVAVFPSGNCYEIATFRQEWYNDDGDGRRPDRVLFTTPETDALRRDLTINSLFYDLNQKCVVDYTEIGIDDIGSKTIRPVGEASLRYQEDRLRVLRTVRFFCRYRSDDILVGLLPETLAAIDSWKGLSGVSGERIMMEFLASLKQSIHVPHYLESCKKLSLFDSMFPGIRIGTSNSRNPAIALAQMCDLSPAELREKLLRLKYESHIFQRASFFKSLAEFTPDKVCEYLKAKQRFDNPILPVEERIALQEGLEHEVLEFMSYCRKDISAFLKFTPSVKASDFPALQGKELGLAIKERTKEEFKSFLVVYDDIYAAERERILAKMPSWERLMTIAIPMPQEWRDEPSWK